MPTYTSRFSRTCFLCKTYNSHTCNDITQVVYVTVRVHGARRSEIARILGGVEGATCQHWQTH